jgi:hypothetical protein
MAVLFSSVTTVPAAISPAVLQAAKEFSRFSTGQTTGLYGFQPNIAPIPIPIATPNALDKKANPWLMMAVLTLFKLPFSFLTVSMANKALFGITLAHSFKEELYGIGAEVLGTIGIKVAEDRLHTDSHSQMSHEKQLAIASGIVSFIGTAITTAGCIKDSKLKGRFSRMITPFGKSLRIVASLAVGTLCGVIEGFFTAKLEPWLEKKLGR